MSDLVIPGTTVEYPHPDYQGYTSPPDVLAINVACLVDADFRHAMRTRVPATRNGDDGFPSMDPAHEAFYADEAKKRLGVSFGADYKFPEGFTPKTFQQAFLKCISPINMRDEKLTEAEKKNLNHVFSLLKELNPEEFKKLKVENLSDEEKYDVVLGMCSKFTMDEINHYMQVHRTNAEHESIPGVQFILSDETKAKLNGVLEQHGTSLAYLGDYTFCNWTRMPEKDFKVVGLRQHRDSEIIDEIRQNPDRFFTILEGTTHPAEYAEDFRRLRYHPKFPEQESEAFIKRLNKISGNRRPGLIRGDGRRVLSPQQKEKDTLVRKGISKMLDLTQKLPPTEGRKKLKRAIVSGYRFFYPKGNGDR